MSLIFPWRRRQDDLEYWRARAIEAEADARHAHSERARLDALINNPHTQDFTSAVEYEAAHQMEKWGNNDVCKSDWEFLGVLTHLGAKALRSCLEGNTEKALHHTITAAALCKNWHRVIKERAEACKPE